MEKFARVAKWVCVGLLFGSIGSFLSGVPNWLLAEPMSPRNELAFLAGYWFATPWAILAIFFHLIEEQAARKRKEAE